MPEEESETFKEENEDLDMVKGKSITQLKRAREKCRRSQGSDSVCYKRLSGAIARKRSGRREKKTARRSPTKRWRLW